MALRGFLGTGAPFWSDFNLVVQLAMGCLLITGMFLARARRYTVHKYVQSSVVLLNLVLIGTIMLPTFTVQIPPQVPGNLGTSFGLVPIIHAAVGLLAEVLALYVITAAGTKVLPERLRFQNFKPWMRTTLSLWWVVVLMGLGTYYVWYMAPGAKLKVHTGSHGAHAFTVSLTDFKFTPGTVTISPGTKVTWVDSQGTHTVHSNTNAFQSKVLNPPQTFSFTFRKAGVYKYHCDFHVSLGMRGEIIVR